MKRHPKTVSVIGLIVLGMAWMLIAGREPARKPAELAPIAAHRSEPGPVLVVGGTRATGLEIVRLLRKRGDAVTVLARPQSDVAELLALGVNVIRGDAMNPESLAPLRNPGVYSAVISTLGTRGRDSARPDFEGNRNVIDAARAAGVRRFVLVTVIGAGDSAGVEPWLAGRFLKEVIALKTQAEDYLQKSGLDWTIVRPGGLLDKPAGTAAFLTEDTRAFSWIGRADLARLTVQTLDDPQAYGKIYHAFDPQATRIWSMF